ncbi:MAG: alpha-L-rhamnosidase C-terminal domain-containing protein [Cytophagales bacterium]|nr:alpha-L-rhamnosidase C-terminal domain-containing protein [Cytophagales bacterium]
MDFSKKILLFISLILILTNTSFSQKKYTFDWKGQWIGLPDTGKFSNLWLTYYKEFNMEKKPLTILANIAVDTKYWLWVNGQMVIFEGGLKRGPTPYDTYFDFLTLTPYIKTGKNTIAVLVWHLGKDGFSHKNSGKHGLIFHCDSLNLYSDSTWKVAIHPAYYTTSAPNPNFRLPEHNVAYDATQNIGEWYISGHSLLSKAKTFGTPPIAPWGNLEPRPIPYWINYGLKNYPQVPLTKKVNYNKYRVGDTITLQLPYNAQVTPYLKIKAKKNKKIHILTDNYYVGGNPEYATVRAEYITKNGIQEYESYGWMNGHEVKYVIPKKVKILDLKYRETGYNTSLSGSFACDDNDMNTLWKKAQRTLYVNMRDSYFDCPDRERAQWWGDAIVEQEQSYYALDKNSHWLFRKGIMEMQGWQRPDYTFFAPVPAGNWSQELPLQMLSGLTKWGYLSYWMHTADKKIFDNIIPSHIAYLNLWQLDTNGVVIHRGGGWDWGDWGQNIDMPLLETAWYYLALKGTAKLMSYHGDIKTMGVFDTRIRRIEQTFNNNFWNGKEYRSPDYKGITDDRGNALAVLADLAPATNYGMLKNVFAQCYNASPYMEKYVLEALFYMGSDSLALSRMKKRYKPMIDAKYSTLWEGWNTDNQSTNNHAWSGGPLTLLSKYIAGIETQEPGFVLYKINPKVNIYNHIAATVSTVKGNIEFDFSKKDSIYNYKISSPSGTICNLYIPKEYKKIRAIELNSKLIWADGKELKQYPEKYPSNPGKPTGPMHYLAENNKNIFITLREGQYNIVVK